MDEPCVNCGEPAQEVSSGWGHGRYVVHVKTGVQLCADGSRRLACLAQVGAE